MQRLQLGEGHGSTPKLPWCRGSQWETPGHTGCQEPVLLSPWHRLRARPLRTHIPEAWSAPGITILLKYKVVYKDFMN